MVEELPDSGIQENFRITEINARFSFNSYLIGMNGQRALQDLRLEDYGLAGAACPDRVDRFYYVLHLLLINSVDSGWHL